MTTRDNPLRIPHVHPPLTAREVAFEDTPSFSQEEREDFIDYCRRAYAAAPPELADAVRAQWTSLQHRLGFVDGSFYGFAVQHSPGWEPAEIPYKEGLSYRDDLETNGWQAQSGVNGNLAWVWMAEQHPREAWQRARAAGATRPNPAPVSARIQIPTPDELMEAYETWKADAIYPPEHDLKLEDMVLFGELVQAIYDEAPSVEGERFFASLHAQHDSHARNIAAVFINTGGLHDVGDAHLTLPDSIAQFSTTGTAAYAHDVIRLGLPRFKGRRGEKGLAKADVETAGWIVIPDTRQTEFAPPDRLLQNLGLERGYGGPDQFLAPNRAFLVHDNPDVGHEVKQWLDSDKGKRRVVSRPRAPDPVAELEEEEQIEEAAAPRARGAPRKPRRLADADLADIHAAATGDGGATTRLATKYRRFVRKMAYSFLKAWSPAAARGSLASAADDIAAEVEQRIFVGTAKAPPAIKKYVVGGKARGRRQPGFSAGAQHTEAGAGTPASFTTWVGAVTRNVARRHVRGAVAAERARTATPAQAAAQEEALDEVLDFEEREAVARRTREQSSSMVEALQTLQADRGNDKELEVLRLRQAGKSYKEMAADLNISVSAVMSRLYRARRLLEKTSGLELRGLVGELREGMGAAVPGKRGRPRKNPAEIHDGWAYFEDAGDVFDLWDAGVVDDDVALEALAALAEFRPDAM